MNSLEFVAYCHAIRHFQYRWACNNIINYAVSLVSEGDYGSAFRLSDGKIGKIYKSYDAAYLAFLDLVQVSINPHLPKIYHRGEFKNFSFVVLEFLTPFAREVYGKFKFDTVREGWAAEIFGKTSEHKLEQSQTELCQEMRSFAKGFCLDFRQENFGFRDKTLVTFDPFTLKTKHNSHLDYVKEDDDDKAA
jgi:hypothetical protein